MSKKELLLASLLLALISVFFFYQVFLKGYIPFPGDLLISEYNPWRTYSYLGYNPGSYPTKLQYFDAIRQLYPWQTLVTDILKKGEIPLWNPYSFSGSPLLANFQSAVFYPLNLLYLVLPQIISWTILVMLQPLLAGIFIYLFTREIGLGKIGSFFSAIAFSYSLFMSVFLEYKIIGHTILWLPFSLLFLEKLTKQVKLINIGIFTISIALILLAGHLQLAVLSLIFITAYGLVKFKKKRLWLVLLALGIGLSSLQIIPTFELIVNSARSSQPYAFLVENLLLQPKQLVGFISPDFFGNPATRNYLLTNSYPGNALYIGLIPFVFSLFSLVLFRKNSLIKFFSLTSLIIILFIVRSPITEILYKIQIPFFSTSSPKNAIFLLSFALSILAGYGLEYWSKDKGQLFKKILFIFGGIFVLCWLLVIATHPAFSSKNFLYSTALFGVLSVLILIGKVIGKRTIMAVLILITVLDLFYFLQKFNPFVSPKLVFPPAQIINFLQQEGGIDRFWGYGTARIEANFATQHQIFSPDGYDPLYPRWYGEFIQSSRDGKIATQFTNQTRSDANIVPGFGQEDLANNLYRLRVLDILGVKYVLDRVEGGTSEITFPTDRFKIIYQDSIWRVFENKRRAPRAFLTADYKIFNNKEEFERLFFDPNFDVAKTLLLEQVPAENLAVDEMSQAKVISYSPNKLLLAVKSRTSQLLFLSDAYYPGWKAFIDGVEKKIYRADYAFRAVVVPSGEHQVKFIYEPQSFSLGVKTSIISLVLLLVLAFWRRRKTYEG